MVKAGKGNRRDRAARTRCPLAGRGFQPALAALATLLILGLAHAAQARDINVFAAASLTEAFGQLATLAQQRHPGWRVDLQFAGSQQLAMQIEQGAPADVFASADEHWMSHLRDRGLLAGEPLDFAHNRLVVIVPKANPGRVEHVEDLARPGIKLVLGAAAVPVGRYSREVLDNLSRTAPFGRDYREHVLRNLVSEEQDVKGVVAKVQLGEADAGMVYGSDVTAKVAAAVRILPIPGAQNVTATYPIAALKNAADLEAARAFVELVLSPEGQRVLREQGLIPVSTR
jgi:molybdate transport system substrate-binding protein